MLEKKARFTALDVVLILLAGSFFGYVLWRAENRLGYQWDFSFIGQYILRYDEEAGRWVPNLLLTGFLNTVRLAVWSTLTGLVLGTLMGLARTANRPFFRLVGRTYVELVRNTPPIVLIFIFYFFFSEQLTRALGLDVLVRSLPETSHGLLAAVFAPPERFTAFASAVITLGVYEGAYITEIVRAGVQSIERGQWEAAYALGLTRFQRMRTIILPQAFKRILPALAGQFISTIKDSAIVSVISVPELSFQGMELMASTYKTFEIWLTVIAMYLCLTLTCSLAMRKLEARLARSTL